MALAQARLDEAPAGQIRLALAGIRRPVALDAGFAETVARVLARWPQAPADDHPQAPVITVRRGRGGFYLYSPWTHPPRRYRDPVDAACALVADLARAWADDNRDALCLHAAASRFGDGLVVFPSHYRAGKSVLAVALAAGGRPLVTDDVLAVDGAGHGIALGVSPRLRLPLPAGEEALANFAAAHAGPGSRRYLYLDLDPRLQLAHGGALPVRALVVLERDRHPALVPMPLGEMLRRMILRNFARELEARVTFDRLRRLAARAPGYVLRYRRLSSAMALLAEAFGP